MAPIVQALVADIDSKPTDPTDSFAHSSSLDMNE